MDTWALRKLIRQTKEPFIVTFTSRALIKGQWLKKGDVDYLAIGRATHSFLSLKPRRSSWNNTGPAVCGC